MNVLIGLATLGAVALGIAFVAVYPGLQDSRTHDPTNGILYLYGSLALGFIATILPAATPGPDHLVSTLAPGIVVVCLGVLIAVMVRRDRRAGRARGAEPMTPKLQPPIEESDDN